MKYLLILAGFLISDAVHAQNNYWQQQVDYKMEVTLRPEDHTLDAFARIEYTNHSPDTLFFIWFHLWPNAYKNDKTAFSDQMLLNGRTDFYFSNNEERGYINRLDFRVNGQVLKTEDHPENIDIIKVVLAKPLPPGESVTITTPFHVKLPFNFSRGGYNGETYQVTQWYPKPAVYDRKGWHPMPYLDQGEFYSEFGNYEVKITVPEKFMVAATGKSQYRVREDIYLPVRKPKKKGKDIKIKSAPRNWSSVPPKTYLFMEEKVHDFAWFADTTFSKNQDTLRLPSGRTIQVQCYFHLDKFDIWDKALDYIKDAVRYHSAWIGEYPYSQVTVVDGEQGFTGGMEYPTITILTGASSPEDLDKLIFHEVGHNWLYGILATNERQNPWMDEGINTFYDNRYEAIKYPNPSKRKGIFQFLKDPRLGETLYRNQAAMKLDQPIATTADSFSAENYNLIAYTKAAEWMQKMENDMGREDFDQAMQEYFNAWKFRHPYPEDLRLVLSGHSKSNIDSNFALLYTKGELPPKKYRPYKIVPFYNLRETYDYRPIFITPVVFYNTFNGLMPGIVLHNYSLPMPRLNFSVAPVYGLKSKKLNGWGRVAYQWYPDRIFRNIELSAIGATFSQSKFQDSSSRTFDLAFYKFAPSLKLQFMESDPRSNVSRYLQLRLFMIGEDQLGLYRDTINNVQKYAGTRERYNILQGRYVFANNRILYPYNLEMLAEVNKDFMRLAFTGNYFFNFTHKGGVNVRFFAGKFIYLSPKTSTLQFQTDRFHLNMTGPKGYEDYTYSNYFIGRTEYEGFPSQQIMIRDGAFKVRTDLLSDKVGKTDNWLSAANLTVDVPDRFNPLYILPIKIPLKLFADIGTYSDAWSQNSGEPRFLYDAGIQVSMLKDLINIYVPVLYSGVYRNYYKSTPGNSFFQRISFSINIQDLSLLKILKPFIQ